MMQKLQRFGGAMFTPVLLFAFSGIILSLSIMFQNEMLVGGFAAEGTIWNNFCAVVESGGWTDFNQIELLFVIGLPMGLAQKQMLVQLWVVRCLYDIQQLLKQNSSADGADIQC